MEGDNIDHWHNHNAGLLHRGQCCNVQSPHRTIKLVTLVTSHTSSSLAAMSSYYRLEHIYTLLQFLPGLHTLNEIRLDNSVQTRYSSTSPTTLIVGDIEELSQQANIPRQLRQPAQPTKQEQEEHRIKHLPYKSWCPICVKAKGASLLSRLKPSCCATAWEMS
eukprot:4828645-Amphidinium_carterae.3